MDKIYAMQLFLCVAERESFTQAAEALNIPKGTVSRQIQALENMLGTPLLYRTTRRVQLTQEGMVYYERARDLLANLDELDNFFQQDPVSVSGRLRVDMPVSLARELVIPKLCEFLQLYPGIELELSSSERKVDIIREGFDCVVQVGRLNDSGLMTRTLGKLSMINCANPDYLSRFGYPENLDDLSSHALVHYAENLGTRPQGFEVWIDSTTRWVKMGGALTVNSRETYQAACMAGLGIIQVPRIGVKSLLKQGSLIEVLPQYHAEPIPVYLLYPHRRNLSRRVHLFMTWLTGVLKHTID